MAIFTAIGAAIFGAGTFLAGATAFGLQVAAGVGVNLLAQKVAGKADTPAATAAAGPGFGVQGSLGSGADSPRSFTMGWRATAGTLVYANTWGSENDTPNAYLTQVIALSDMPLQSGANGLVGLWVNGELCDIEWDNEDVPRGYPVTQYRENGTEHLWVKFYNGTQSTADSLLTGTVGGDDRPYQSTRVGAGVAYAVVTARVKDTLFSGFPKYKFELGGIPLYDISKDSSVGGDGSQRWDNPATWGGDGDHLPAVQIYNILRGITYGGQWLYGLQGVSAASLPAAHWIAQVEKCREAVEAADGGTEPRYRSSLEVFVNNDIASTIEALLTACQGRLTETGGIYNLYCGTPDDAVMSFTDDDIISTQEQSFTPFFGLSDTITGISAKYPSPEESWNSKPAPPIYRSDYEDAAGGRRLMADVSLDTVPYARQVQQLMREALQEGQRARRHTFTLPPKFWPLEPGDIVAYTSERNGYEGKLFRVDGVIDKANLEVMVDLTEVDPSDYDWNTTDHYTPPVIGPTGVRRPPAQAISDFDAEPYTIRDDLGLPRRPAILLTWNTDLVQDDVAGVQYEVRLAFNEEIVTRGRTDNPTAGSVVVSQSLVDSTDYEVRGKLIPGSARLTDWSGWIPVTTPNVKFSLEDFNAALRHEMQTKIAQIQAELKLSNDLLATLVAEQDAAVYTEKEKITTEIIRQRGKVMAAYRNDILLATGPDSALVQRIEEARAEIETAENRITAAYKNEVQTYAGPNSALAQNIIQTDARITSVNNALTQEITASTQARFYAGVAPAGAVARLDLYTQAQLAFAGMSIIAFDDLNGNRFGHIRFQADRFYIEGGYGGSGVPIFIVDGVTGNIYLNGNVIAPGSVTVGMLEAGVFQAINATITGQLNAYQLNANQINSVIANITNLTAQNINSNYAIYNRFSGISSPVTFSVSNTGSGGGGPGPTKSGSGLLYWSQYAAQANSVLVTGSLLFSGGTDPGLIGAGSPGLSCSVTFGLNGQSGLLASAVLVSEDGSGALPTNLNGRSFSATLLARVSPGEIVTPSITYNVFVGGLGGSGTLTWTWRLPQMNLLFLEPRGG